MTATLDSVPHVKCLITGRIFAIYFILVFVLARAIGAPYPASGYQALENGFRTARSSAAESDAHEAANGLASNQAPKVEKSVISSHSKTFIQEELDHSDPLLTSAKDVNAEELQGEEYKLKLRDEFKLVDLPSLQNRALAHNFVRSHGFKTSNIGKIDELLTSVKNLKSWETTLSGLHWYSFKLDRWFFTVNSNYKEAILEEMHKHGEKAEEWLKSLKDKLIEATSSRLTDEWKMFWETVESEMEHKRRQGGLHQFFNSLFKRIFQHSKRWEEKLNLQFLKIRRMNGMDSETKGRTLELERMQRAGISLSPQERALVKKISKGVSKLTGSELNLLPRLTGHVIPSRRVAQINELIARLTAWGKAVNYVEIEFIARALRTLKEHALQRLEWTGEQRDLVMAVGKTQTISEMKALEGAHKALLHKLAAADSVRMCQDALRSLELEDGQGMSEAADLRLKLLKASRVESGSSLGKDEDVSGKFTQNEWQLIQELSDRHMIRQSEFSLHVHPKTPDPREISTEGNLKSADQRAKEVLERMPQKSSQLTILLDTLKRPRSPDELKLTSSEAAEVQALAGQLVEETIRKDDRAKALALFRFLNPDLHREAKLSQPLVLKMRRLLQHGALSSELSVMSRDFARTYEEVIDSMSAEEKALYHLKITMLKNASMKSEATSRTDFQKALKDKLIVKGILHENDKLRVIRLARAHWVPTVRQLALQRLETRQNFRTVEEASLLKKLRFGKYLSLSKEEDQYIINLAQESALVQKANVPNELEQSAMKLTRPVKLSDLEVQLGLFQNFKLDELVELARLNSLSSNNHEFEKETKLSKILILLMKAEDRRAINLQLTRFQNFPKLLNQQKDTKLRQLQQTNLAINKKVTENLQFMKLMQQQTAGTIKLPRQLLNPVLDEYHKFLRITQLVEPKAAGHVPPPNPLQGPPHAGTLVESKGESGPKVKENSESNSTLQNAGSEEKLP